MTGTTNKHHGIIITTNSTEWQFSYLYEDGDTVFSLWNSVLLVNDAKILTLSLTHLSQLVKNMHPVRTEACILIDFIHIRHNYVTFKMAPVPMDIGN